MLSSAWTVVRATLAARDATVFDKRDEEVTPAEFSARWEQLDDRDPEAAVYGWTVVIGSNGGLALQLQDLRNYNRVLGTGFHLEDTPYFHKNLARLLAEVFLLPDVAVSGLAGGRQGRLRGQEEGLGCRKVRREG
jgi:hypothetical protein